MPSAKSKPTQPKPTQSTQPKPTSERITLKDEKKDRVVYVGPRGGKYVKKDGQFVSLKSMPKPKSGKKPQKRMQNGGVLKTTQDTINLLLSILNNGSEHYSETFYKVDPIKRTISKFSKNEESDIYPVPNMIGKEKETIQFNLDTDDGTYIFLLYPIRDLYRISNVNFYKKNLTTVHSQYLGWKDDIPPPRPLPPLPPLSDRYDSLPYPRR